MEAAYFRTFYKRCLFFIMCRGEKIGKSWDAQLLAQTSPFHTNSAHNSREAWLDGQKWSMPCNFSPELKHQWDKLGQFSFLGANIPPYLHGQRKILSTLPLSSYNPTPQVT